MVINENNSYINTFTGGMNSDSAYDQLDNKHYVYGKNIRITKNQQLGEGILDYASVHEGIVSPVPEGLPTGHVNIEGKILAVDSVGRLVTIISHDDTTLHVYKMNINEEENTIEDGSFKEIWYSENFWNNKEVVPEKLSTVLYQELNNVVKLYIATGKTPILIIDVNRVKIDTPKDCLMNNRIVPQNRVYIQNIISGRLKTQLVQYTYRLYNKYANTTQLAPLTNKIQVIDGSRAKENGNAEDTETSIGFTLSIKRDDSFWNYFDRIQVYRLSYIKPNENAEVSLIYDDKLPADGDFILNDVGIEPLQSLIMEEFAAMSGIILVPQVIEQNQNYMFCGNVKDDTIIKDIEITKENWTETATPYKEVKADIVLAELINGQVPQHGEYLFIDGDFNYTDYFTLHDINPALAKANYENIITSSLLRSLRRGEEYYRYAIVLYDKYGRRTDVYNLGDEITPSYADSMPFSILDGKLMAHPIGVNIKLPKISSTEFDVNDIIGCLIVRRNSSDVYQKTLLQIALARPVNQGLALTNAVKESVFSEDTAKYSPYYPTGFLSVNDLTISPTYYYLALNKFGQRASVNNEGLLFFDDVWENFWAKMRSNNLFLIFSSEIDYRRDDVLAKLNVSDMNIKELYYIPAQYRLHNADQDRTIFYGLGSVGSSDTQYTPYTYIQTKSYEHHTIATGPENAASVWYIPCSDLLGMEVIKARVGAYFVTFQLEVYAGNDISLILGGQTPLATITANDGSNIAENQNIMSHLNTEYITFMVRSDLDGDLDLEFWTGTENSQQQSSGDNRQLHIKRYDVKPLSHDDKENEYWVFNYFSLLNDINKRHSGFGAVTSHEIKLIKDVKIPNWEDSFSNIQRDSDELIFSAVKKYKQFTTNIDKYVYNNWCSFGKYDLRPGVESLPNVTTGELNTAAEFLPIPLNYTDWQNKNKRENPVRYGYIGAGGSCFLLATENENPGGFETYIDGDNPATFWTSICNIMHTPKLDNVEPDEVVQYYGFGNYFKVHVGLNGQLVSDNNDDYVTVFDGDIYITPHEFTTMYKTYNFESVDSLLSTQITSYVPLESKVNTYFDYGMNLRNTNSANLMNEPGVIDGVNSQERPAHQYNMIYSDNDASNDLFTLISTDKDETNQFKQRAYFSEPKINGEFIDNFPIFKPVSFIDVDSQYGEITNLDTDKNNLFYWQDNAFGKFSVNERSLVNDQNGNSIMLGQAGILSRYDYISTKYGMRLHDLCSRSTENGMYWVDINNKAIVASAGNQAVNYGELLFVQNIINKYITNDVPYVDYDIQNNELLCKCFNKHQMVFNVKYNIATSIYTRQYDDIIYVKNHIFGIESDNIQKYNYTDVPEYKNFLAPMLIEFIVNPNTSITKVFDSQQIIPIKRSIELPEIFNSIKMYFETDLYKVEYGFMKDTYTDREGNIVYNIPRFSLEDYGSRMRGKWMKVGINTDKATLTQYTTMSHVITKFRQSFS